MDRGEAQGVPHGSFQIRSILLAIDDQIIHEHQRWGAEPRRTDSFCEWLCMHGIARLVISLTS